MIIKKFEAQAGAFAGKPAVITGGKELTYKKLNDYANQVARAILKVNNAPEGIPGQGQNQQVVGLLFEHGADMIVGLIGALKADTIYVPLNITYPENRLISMLDPSGANLILTNNTTFSLAEKLVEKTKNNVKLLNIQSIISGSNFSTENLKREPCGDRLAYILYTSGSTGEPRGVLQDHKNVCYFIENFTRECKVSAADRITLLSAFSHDAAVVDIFGALLNGAVLYPFNILEKTNVAALSQWLINEEITIWHSVPTLFRYFINTLTNDDIGRFVNLRLILLGGEAVRKHDLQEFQRFFPHSVLVNIYGQTESTISSLWQFKPGDASDRVLIGKPLQGTDIFLVDEEDEIVEDLGVGEIIVASDHVARGYWQDNETTDRVFSHDPSLGKLYWTGDMGCLLADGSIEFVGREDHQVKIRGFRVELEEIENRLLTHDAVKEVVVAAKEDDNNVLHLCAYIVPHTSEPVKNSTFTVSEMREYLSGDLPDYMIPSHLVHLEEFPLTPSGKVDRNGLPEPEHFRPRLGVTYVAPETSLEKEISNIWKDILGLDKVGIHDNFFDLGGTSFDILNLIRKVYEVFQKDIPVVAMFRYPTIRSFVEFLGQEETGNDDLVTRTEARQKARQHQIAVIGMACKFPGSKNIHEFWENLKNGKESITFFTDDQLREAGADDALISNPSYVKARGVIEDVEYFDAAFFNYSPKEGQIMDPQLRILHECTWEALETAGYDPDSYDGLIGLYAGNAMTFYWMGLILLNGLSIVDLGFLYHNYTTIVSYRLNLRGPSVIVQSACSTSLVAVHMGCQGLIDHECDIALAGGVSVLLPTRNGYKYEEGMMWSKDGHCRTFDANASGTIFSDGVGIVALKRLEDAIAHGDHIYAVIKGSGINNDGKRKVGLASPSVEGQAELIGRVLKNTGIEPESIGYVEAHGTGTMLGDPVELEALRLGFNTDKRGYCRIGSAKTNIGHLNTAAASAGFIKTVLAMQHRLIPPSLHFETPNPKFDFENSPFIVNTELTEWKSDKYPLRAAVSAFGIGGTNAHVILEEPLQRDASSQSRALQMILLSAVSEPALEQLSKNLAAYFKENPEVNLADAVYTLQVGRKACKLRKMVLCSGVEEAVQLLESPPEELTPETGQVQTTLSDDDNIPVVFMFPGQGSQYVNMGWDLYRQEPDFAREMQACFEILKPLMGFDLKEILYPGISPQSAQSTQSEKFYNKTSAPSASSAVDINQTEITQPLIFALEYAMAKLLMRWGIQPFAMVGHSIGEYVAACLAGVFSLEDALKLVVLRGKLMQRMPTGAMLSIPLPEDELTPLLQEANVALKGNLSLAAVNSTSYCVVSGPHEAIAAFEKQLSQTHSQLQHRRLHTSHAYHSAMMEPILEEFAGAVSQVTLNKPRMPYISNVTGNWISVEQATDPQYWAGHIRSTVRFAQGLTLVLKETNTAFLEVGPGRALSTFVRQHKNKAPGQFILNLIRHPKENLSDNYYLLSKIGRLWLMGKKIDWQGFYFHEKRYRIPLPTYPFQGQYYWLQGNPFKVAVQDAMGTPAPTSGKRSDIADWLYIPSWKGSALPPVKIPAHKSIVPQETFNWLVFMDEPGIGALLVEKLKKQGHQVILVTPGPGFKQIAEDKYTIDPGQGEDYGLLLGECSAGEKVPRRILHLWNVTAEGALADQSDPLLELDRQQEMGFYSLVYLAQAIGSQSLAEEIQLTVFTNRMQVVLGEDLAYPQKATIIGPVLAIPQEYSNVKCRSIDIIIPQPGTPAEKKLSDLLLRELLTDIDDALIAFRENSRWVKGYEPYPLDKPGSETPRLREQGVYLVTGGLGGIGLVLSQYLAQQVKAKLILTGRTPLPAKEEWDQWLESHVESDRTSQKIKKIRELEDLGAQVMVISADAADKKQMQQAIRQAEQQLGNINGVIHSAGIADGALVQLRTKEMSQQVMASKVTGTLVLDELLNTRELDFFILCSSTSAVAPPLGQVAYCAANNFLDNFAHYKSFKDNTFTVSLNWGAWQEVGMAAESALQLAGAREIPVPGIKTLSVDYPFFEKCEVIEENRVVYISQLRVHECWLLDEHRILGKATMPGTGYLELARAAFDHHTRDLEENGSRTIELSEFYTLFPLVVGEDEVKEMRIVFKKEDDSYTFSFISRVSPGKDRWLEHARGKAALLTGDKSRQLGLKEIQETCKEREFIYKSEDFVPKPGAITFGPRWNNLRQAKFGANQVLAFLELSQNFAHDTDFYKLHPALLDVGNPILKKVEREIKNDPSDSYLPIFYKRVKIKAGLPQKVIFHVTHAGENKPNAEILRYNITIMDEQGMELVDIQEYAVKMVKAESHTVDQFDNQQRETSPLQQVENLAQSLSFFIGDDSNDGARSAQSYQSDLLKDAISPREGVDVFARVLEGEGFSQLVVSPTDLLLRLQRRKKPVDQDDQETVQESKTMGPRLSRPAISTAYAVPQTETEKMIAEIWQEQLGIDQVGINDDFFELGGDSLKAITVTGKIHKNSHTEMPLAEFFNRPTVRLQAEYISTAGKGEELLSIEPVENKEYYPLSSAQERLYVLYRLDPGNTGYNLTQGILYRCDIDRNYVNGVVKQFINRHESLRTSFILLEGQTYQRIHREVDYEIECYDLKKDGVTREEIIESFVRPFDLEKAPLMRISLVKIEDKRHMMLIDIHHIIADAHSILAVLQDNFAALMEGGELPPMKLQYRDFSQWQNQQEKTGILKKQEAFWMEEFKDGVPVLELPSDYDIPVAPGTKNYAGDWVTFYMETSLIKEFKELLLEEEATLFMGMMAVFNILLSRLSGKEDIVVGVPTLGRGHPDLLPIMGMFVNILVLRNFPSTEKTFSQFLQDLKQRSIKAFENQDYQFEDLVEKLASPRDPNKNPLFNVSFTLQNVVGSPLDDPADFGREFFDIKTRASKFDLGLEVIERGEIIYCKFEYRTQLFKQETIERFGGYFKEIVSMLTRDRNITLKDIVLTHDLLEPSIKAPEMEFKF